MKSIVLLLTKLRKQEQSSRWCCGCSWEDSEEEIAAILAVEELSEEMPTTIDAGA